MHSDDASFDAPAAQADAAPAPAAPAITFDDLGLSEPTLRAVHESGYNTPTPIQAQAIPIVLQGRDVLGIAQTGTGKTAGFTLPMIDILAGGRTKARLIGGVSFGDQDALLSAGVDVLIATPGRLLDHFERGKLLLSGVQVMVVDEADRMLDMGFIPDIERIFKLTPFTRQTLFFSATMPPEITRLTDQFLSNPKRIEATKPATAATTIDQRIVRLPGGDPRTRRAALRAVIASCGEIKNGIIFCNRKTDVDVVAQSLKRHGLNAAPIHGDLDQSLRTKTLERFRSGELTLLVASDVAARGLDIPAVGQVFNYEPPRHADDYVHRIGRTGRAGRSGQAFTLVAPSDGRNWDAIEKLTGLKILDAEIADLPTEALGDPRDSGGRGRRADELKRQRSDRKDRFKKRDPGRPEAATEPAKVVERVEGEADVRPAREERVREDRPREERAPRSERRDDRGPRQDARRDQPRGERRDERGPRRDDRREEMRPPREERDQQGVVGFGDSMPAFLKRKG